MSISDEFKRILRRTDDWADWRKKAFEDQTGCTLQEMKNKYFISDENRDQPIKVEYSDLIKEFTTDNNMVRITLDVSAFSYMPIGFIILPDDKWDEVRQICANLGIEIEGE